MNNSYAFNNTVKHSVVSPKSSAAFTNKASSSNVKASSATSSASAKSSTPAKKVVPKVVSLKDRTNVTDVNDSVRKLEITDRKGNLITALVKVPGYQTMLDINDSRSIGTMSGHTVFMKPTSVNYYDHLFNTIHNVEINHQPTPMGWKFANKHHEAFRWLTNQASSFLADKFDAD